MYCASRGMDRRVVPALFRPLILPVALALLLGCGAAPPASDPPAAPKVETTRPVSCLRRRGRELDETFLFDAQRNLLSSKRVGGDAITFERSLAGELLRYELLAKRGYTIDGRFVFGPHHELVAARITSSSSTLPMDESATMKWRGTFAPIAGPTRPFAPYGGPGGAGNTGMSIQLLSIDLTLRHATNAMPPVSFTGTVDVLHWSSPPWRETWSYRDGRALSRKDTRGGHGEYTWDAEGRLMSSHECDQDEVMFGRSPGRCYDSTYEVSSDGSTHSVTHGGPGEIQLAYDAEGRLVSGLALGYGNPQVDTITWEECAVPGVAAPAKKPPAASMSATPR